MARKLVFLLSLVLILVAPISMGLAQPSGLPVDIPRNQVFVADQIFRYDNVDNFNMWVNGPAPADTSRSDDGYAVVFRC